MLTPIAEKNKDIENTEHLIVDMDEVVKSNDYQEVWDAMKLVRSRVKKCIRDITGLIKNPDDKSELDHNKVNREAVIDIRKKVMDDFELIMNLHERCIELKEEECSVEVDCDYMKEVANIYYEALEAHTKYGENYSEYVRKKRKIGDVQKTTIVEHCLKLLRMMSKDQDEEYLHKRVIKRPAFNNRVEEACFDFLN